MRHTTPILCTVLHKTLQVSLDHILPTDSVVKDESLKKGFLVRLPTKACCDSYPLLFFRNPFGKITALVLHEDNECLSTKTLDWCEECFE